MGRGLRTALALAFFALVIGGGIAAGSFGHPTAIATRARPMAHDSIHLMVSSRPIVIVEDHSVPGQVRTSP